jgi:hypothetical protein
MNENQISLVVKSNDFDDVTFTIKQDTHLEKLFIRYCQRQNLKYESVAFLFRGTKIGPKDVPRSLEMINGDEVHCIINQIGGGEETGLS